MYAVTGPYQTFAGNAPCFTVEGFNIYYTDTSIELVRSGHDEIYDMLCFDNKIELLEPKKDQRYLVFVLDRAIYYYIVAEQQIMQTAFTFEYPACGALEISEKTILLADVSSLIIYAYHENSIITKQDVGEAIDHCSFFHSNDKNYVLLNGSLVYIQVGVDIKLHSRLESPAIAIGLLRQNIITAEISANGLSVKFKGNSVFVEQCVDVGKCEFLNHGDSLRFNLGQTVYKISTESGALALLEDKEAIQYNYCSKSKELFTVDHNIFVYWDFQQKIEKIVPCLLYYNHLKNELTIESITATKQLTFACDTFELYSFISTNRYQIFATSRYNEETNESHIDLFGIEEFDTCQTINDVVVFGKVISLVLEYFDDHFACTMFTEDQDVYVYNVTDKSVACINVEGCGYQYVYETRQLGILIGISGDNQYLINAIDEHNLETAEIDKDTVNIFASDYFVMYSKSPNGKFILPFGFSLQGLHHSIITPHMRTLDGAYKIENQYFDINPMQIIQYINFYMEKCQKDNKYVAAKIIISNDNYFNESSSFSVSCEVSTATEITESDFTWKIKEKLYLPDIIALKEKYLSMCSADILRQSITRTAEFCDFLHLELDDDNEFFYYSQVFLCLFNTCKKFNNFGFTTLEQESMASILHLLIPIIKALDDFQGGNGLVQTVAEYVGVDSYHISDMRLFCSIQITGRNYEEIKNYQLTYSILVVFSIIYCIQVMNEKFDNFYLFKEFEAYIQEYCSNELCNLSLLAVYDFMEGGTYCLYYSAIMLLLIYYTTKCQDFLEQVEETHLWLLSIESQLEEPRSSNTEKANYYILCLLSFCPEMSECITERIDTRISTEKAFLGRELQGICNFLVSERDSFDPLQKPLKKTRRILEIQYLLSALAIEIFEIDDIFREKFDDLDKDLSIAERLVVEMLCFAPLLPDEANRYFMFEQLAKFFIRSAVTKAQQMFRQIILSLNRSLYAGFEKFLNFVRNAYPALIQYYGAMIIEYIIPIEEQQFQQQILSEGSTEILQQILRIIGVLTRTCDHACTTKHGDTTTLFLSTQLRQLRVFDYAEYQQRVIFNNAIYDVLRPVELDQTYILGFSEQEMTIILINSHATEGVCVPLLQIQQHGGLFRRYERQGVFVIPDAQVFLGYHVNAEKQLIVILRSSELENQEFNQHCIRINTAFQRGRIIGYFKVKRGSFVESRFTRRFEIAAAENADQIKLVIQ